MPVIEGLFIVLIISLVSRKLTFNLLQTLDLNHDALQSFCVGGPHILKFRHLSSRSVTGSFRPISDSVQALR